MEVECETKGEKIKIKSKKIIFAIPPHNLSQIEFTPSLPHTKINTPKILSYSEKYIKTFVVYNERWWTEKNFSGQILSDKGPLLWSCDGHKGDSKHGVLVGFIRFIFLFFYFFTHLVYFFHFLFFYFFTYLIHLFFK